MSTLVRIGQAQFEELCALLTRRYPDDEWATFAWAGWRETPDDLVLTFAALNPPKHGELNEDVGHVQFFEPYTLRNALEAEAMPLAIVVTHSHPCDFVPLPSRIDDDMDGYFVDFFSGFAPNRPYLSLIVSKMSDQWTLSGRVFWRGRWKAVDRFVVEAIPVSTLPPNRHNWPTDINSSRVQRFVDAFGAEAAVRLRESTVAVVGAGGTGSAAIEVLARAGVGRIVLIDWDELQESNLERVHGSVPQDAQRHIPKIEIARRHIHQIDPAIDVVAISGRVPQSLAIDSLVRCDVALGCSDSHAGRVALAELGWRYSIAVIDCGVALEGGDGDVTGQIVQLTRFGPSGPCALCRGMYDAVRVTQELMSDEEKERRRAGAQAAVARGEKPDPYWSSEPQLNTVGYLTTSAGALQAGYAIGLITGRFSPPFNRLQMNLTAPWLDVTDQVVTPTSDCVCQTHRGWGDQGGQVAITSAPRHWPEAKRI